MANDHAKGGKGLSKTHQVIDKTTGQPVEPAPSQADWMDKTKFPRDRYERVDETGASVPDEGGDTGTTTPPPTTDPGTTDPGAGGDGTVPDEGDPTSSGG